MNNLKHYSMKVFFRQISLLLLVLTFTALSTQVYAASGH